VSINQMLSIRYLYSKDFKYVSLIRAPEQVWRKTTLFDFRKRRAKQDSKQCFLMTV